ncbi:MAG: CBS domain-containing protein [Bacteroidota bacterium]
MIAKELINYMIPPLKTSDPISKVKLGMRELRVFELPVTADDRFLGLITDDQLDEVADGDLNDYDLEGESAVVQAHQHYYDVLKVANREAVSLVAVVDDYGKYLGVIALEDIVEAFSKTAAVSGQGTIIRLTLNAIDYSLSEISRLIEENGVKILSSYVVNVDNDPSKIMLTLKLNEEEVGHAIATLSRFGYVVETSYAENSKDEQERERLDGLLNYLRF